MDEGAQGTAGLRTGVESDDTFTIETNGINPIPLSDRHGKPFELFWVWSGANIIFTYVIVGAVIVGFGIGFWPAIAAVVVGNLFYVLVGVGAISGPKAGTATLAVSRSAFGVLGNIPAAFLSWLTVVGWEAVNIVIGTFALYQLALLVHIPGGTLTKVICLALVMVATFAVAMWGHATIVFMQKIFTVLLAVGTFVLGVFVLSKIDFHPAAVPLAADNSLSTWLLALIVIASLPFSWVNYPADYARYFKPDESSKSIVLWTTIGAIIPAVLIGVIGVAAATATNMTDPVGGLAKLVPSGFFGPYLAVIVGGTITNNFLNVYSSGLSLLAMGVPLPRYKSVWIDAIIGGLMSIYAVFIFDFTNSFIEFLSLMVIWIAPWFGVYLADMLLRRNTYDVRGLHQFGGGPYWYRKGWNWRALVAFAAGILAAGAFANSPLWRGPFVGLIGGGDISIWVGFVLAFVVYYVLMRAAVTVEQMVALTEPVPTPAVPAS